MTEEREEKGAVTGTAGSPAGPDATSGGSRAASTGAPAPDRRVYPGSTVGAPAGGPDTRRRGGRIAAAVAAVSAVLVVIALYLAFGVPAGDPLKTAEPVPAGSASAPAQVDNAASEPKKVDVGQVVTALSFDGEQVGVPADKARVAAKDGRVLVSAAAGDADDAVVRLSARRMAALAGQLKDLKIDGTEVSSVTWVAEGADGSVQFTGTMAPVSAPTSGGTGDILRAAHEYAATEAVWAAAGDDVSGMERAAGDAPTDLDGAPIEVGAASKAVAEETGASTASGSAASSGGSASSAGGSAGTTSSSSSQTGSSSGSSASAGAQGAQQSSTITVHVSVDASAAGGGTLASTSLSLKRGASAYDALRATGLSVNARSTVYGVYVAAIGGFAEFDHGDGSGWTYYVNGVFADRSAGAWTLSDGDSVSWVYVAG